MLGLLHVRRRLGGVDVLRGVTGAVAGGELLCLVGPSGCGKTTLLRIIAGLEPLDSGEVVLGGRDQRGIPPERRPVGLVFQNPALWPHLTVGENVGYGLRVRGVADAERARRVEEELERFGIRDLSDRLPEALSGGQRQRAALARALAVRPEVLLLDEPLSQIDPRQRAELREEIRRVQRELRITMVYVTHDPAEALAVGDRIGMLLDGILVQVDAPEALYRRPFRRAVADFFGPVAWLEGVRTASLPGGVRVATALGEFDVDADPGSRFWERGWLGIRPERIRDGWDSHACNCFAAVASGAVFLGAMEEWVLEGAGGVVLRMRRAPGGRRLAAGSRECFGVPPSDLIWVGRD